MKKFLLTLSSILSMMLFSCNILSAQHTFSIVTIDSITHEVGSAGASFVSDAPLEY